MLSIAQGLTTGPGRDLRQWRLQLSWIKRHSTDLDAKSPIDIMHEQGLFGLAKMMRYLDYQLVT